MFVFFFFFSSRRRHTRFDCDWSSDVCSSDLARDSGVNFIDTADVYCKGESEKIVGRIVAATRDSWVLATKVANPMGDDPDRRGDGRPDPRREDPLLGRLQPARLAHRRGGARLRRAGRAAAGGLPALLQ